MMKPSPGYRSLLIFNCVGENFSIGQAAEAIGLSQPAISLTIKKLEALIGRKLLRRGTKGSEATPDGALLLRRTARMLHQVELGISQILNLEPASRVVRAACRRLTDTQIRTHIAILKSASASEAATSLGVSQAAIHRAGQAIEHAVGIPLYRRTGSRLVVNSAGVQLGRRLQLALNEISQALDELASSPEQLKGRVRVGVLPLSPQHFLADILSRVAQLYPYAIITVQEDNYLNLQTDLRSGQIDVIFGALRTPRVGDDLSEVDLFSDPYEIVVRNHHPLAGRESVNSSDLLKYKWVVPPQNTPRHQISLSLFQSFKKQPPQLIETNSLAMIIALLQKGDFIAILSRTQVFQSGFTKDLIALNFELSNAGRVIGLISRKDWLPTELQNLFIKCIENSALSLK